MSYFAKGSKEGILANLYSVLSTLSAPHALQFLDYQRVYPNTGGRISDYPGCYLNDMRIDKVRLLKDIVHNVFTVALVCWLWAQNESQLATEMNAFYEAIKDKIMADTTRNNNAYDTVIQSVATDAGSRSPQGQFIIVLQIPFWSDE